MDIFVIGGVLLIFLLYLGWECHQLKQKRRQIPVRICVTGTRGKSSVVRLVAAALRESGRQVVAKTTGSKPMVILPDGSEREVLRRGLPSVLEGKRLINLAVREKAEFLVTEMMSINPESLLTESLRIFAPGIMVITNVRSDHREQWGDSKPAIAGYFAAAVPAGSTLFVPVEEIYAAFQGLTCGSRVELHSVPEEALPPTSRNMNKEFSQNIRLALAASCHLGLTRETALNGLLQVNPDFGSLQVWQTRPEGTSATWYLVSGFAANDPESTSILMAKISHLIPLPGKKLVGLLNLRWDRADRTRQWLDAICSGVTPEFDILALVGGHARAVYRKLVKKTPHIKVLLLPDATAGDILPAIRPLVPGDAVVVGMGNMEGAGAAQVSKWAEIGEPYVI